MNLEYVGTDLEAMCFARNYHQWILEEFRPFLGKRMIEVGSGTGDFSELLLTFAPEYLALIEPSLMVEKLKLRFESGPFTDFSVINSTFAAAAGEIRKSRPDSIIYVNVLEHIENDLSELQAVSSTLDVGGRIFIFVPAHAWLYGEFDRSVGHFRRYARVELEKKCASAGFRPLCSKYVDMLGVVPWWITYRLIRSSILSPTAVRRYDKYLVPLSRIVDRISGAPTGKNILFIGERI